MITAKEQNALKDANFDSGFIQKCKSYDFPNGLNQSGFITFYKDNEYLIRSK